MHDMKNDKPSYNQKARTQPFIFAGYKDRINIHNVDNFWTFAPRVYKSLVTPSKLMNKIRVLFGHKAIRDHYVRDCFFGRFRQSGIAIVISGKESWYCFPSCAKSESELVRLEKAMIKHCQ